MNKSRLERFLDFSSSGAEVDIPGLLPEEIYISKNRIKEVLGLSDVNDKNLMGVIYSLAKPCFLISPENLENEFDIFNFIDDISLDDNVLLVWDDWVDVDKTSVRVLMAEFSNLWFPVADDLNIFDTEGRWVVCIDHNGYVSVLRRTKNERNSAIRPHQSK
jgi:hypothetical protein